jgi:hypothetical protein
MDERARYFLITGSDEICEVVALSELFGAVHGMFCCDKDAESCDNPYFEAFKEEFKDGVDFEGWKENLEDGWLNVEELPAKPKQLADQEEMAVRLSALQQSHDRLLWALKNLVRVTTVDMSIMQLLYRTIQFDEARAAIVEATQRATKKDTQPTLNVTQ